MLKRILLVTVILVVALSAKAQTANDFDRYFTPKVMRMDYLHTGNQTQESYFFERLKQEPYWAGSRTHLIDTLMGNQMVRVYDKVSGKLIYAQGFNTLFNEWQTTPEALTANKGYREAVIFPYPKNKVTVELLARNRSGRWDKKFSRTIDPSSYFITQFTRAQYPVFDVQYNGIPESHIDIVLLSEGYTEGQRERFENDCRVFAEGLFSQEPFKSRAKEFNIRGVWSPSKEQGATTPAEGRWLNTTLSSSFYTFDMDRYIMVDDFQRVRDVAASAPYDYIYILANTPKYGGGAIYNFYGISCAGHPTKVASIYLHEMGHLLAGLGDEYQGDASFNDPYPSTVEPWETNLTTLKDLASKTIWSRLLNPKTAIPTTKSQPVGVYEGAGYMNKGVYRPSENCMMRNLKEFCPVCAESIVETIDFKTK